MPVDDVILLRNVEVSVPCEEAGRLCALETHYALMMDDDPEFVF